MRDWYCSAQRVERIQVFAVLSAADEPAARLRHFHFDRRRLVGDAKRRALEIAAVRGVLPVLPVHQRLRCDAQALHDGPANFRAVSLRMRTTKSRICMN